MPTQTKPEPKIVATIDLTSFLPKKNERTVNTVDPESFNVLIYGPPGTGKSTFLGCFPNLIWACCEDGHKLIPGNKVIIDCWKHEGKAESPYRDQFENVHMSFVQFVDLMQTVEDYKTIGIDTIDRLVDMCISYHCKKAGLAHMGDVQDFGVTYDKVRNFPIRDAIMDLMKTGRGIVFVTHENTKQFEGKNGKKNKKETSLADKQQLFITSQCDVIIHTEYGGVTDEKSGLRDLIFRADPDEDMMSKNRGDRVPKAWIVPYEPKKCWEQYSGFFKDPKNIQAAYNNYKALYNE